MNKQDRKELQSAVDMLSEISGRFDEARSIIEEIAGREQEKFDNLTEGLQAAERGQMMEAAASALSDVHSEMENFSFDDIISQIEGAMEG